MRKFFIFFYISFLVIFSTIKITGADSNIAGNTNQNYLQGKKLYDEKRYREAYPLLLKAAEAGDSNAMMHLGKMYYNGWGVVHNHETGRMWHEKAARLGNAESVRKLKSMDMHDPDSRH